VSALCADFEPQARHYTQSEHYLAVATLEFSPKRCKLVPMRRTVDLDAGLETELTQVVSLTKEKPAVVIRQALWAGLPAVASRFQSPRPAGYFAGDYGPDPERAALEPALGKVRQKPER
jgi:hypothetical protein